MNTNTNQEPDDAEEILEALRQIQDNPALQAEAKTEPESVLDRLKLSGAARHAVAFGITAVLLGHLAPAPRPYWWS
jgi:hypothetical protein